MTAHGSGDVLTLALLSGEAGTVVAKRTLKASNLRTGWFDLPLSYHGDGSSLRASITTAANASVELDYFEVFPKHFTLALGEGDKLFMLLREIHHSPLVWETSTFSCAYRLGYAGITGS